MLSTIAAIFSIALSPKSFLRGGDVSEIPQVEATGSTYFYRGQPIDPFDAMERAGWNFVRFRIWNNPKDGWCDEAHTLALAQRAKAHHLKISLDFHYSDWWADPQKQIKPAAWKDLPFDDLAKAVHDFTKKVVADMIDQGTPPIMVQVGNEITPGMLWPDGRNNSPEGWKRLAKLVGAGCQGVKDASRRVKTMIHLDKGGDNKGARWWFDHLRAEHVSFDLIGLSYYPWWHGHLDALASNLTDLSQRYRKDVYIVETAYPWKVGRGLTDGLHPEPGYPASPEGQAAYLARLTEILSAVPHGRGKGLLYWAPAWIGPDGASGGYSNLALFSEKGEALPGFDTLKPPK